MARKFTHYLLERYHENDKEIDDIIKRILENFFSNNRTISKEMDFEFFETNTN